MGVRENLCLTFSPRKRARPNEGASRKKPVICDSHRYEVISKFVIPRPFVLHIIFAIAYVINNSVEHVCLFAFCVWLVGRLIDLLDGWSAGYLLYCVHIWKSLACAAVVRLFWKGNQGDCQGKKVIRSGDYELDASRTEWSWSENGTKNAF